MLSYNVFFCDFTAQVSGVLSSLKWHIIMEYVTADNRNLSYQFHIYGIIEKAMTEESGNSI